MATTYAWLWTVFAFVLTWMISHFIKRKKAANEEEDTKAEERRDGVADVIIVGAGVAGAALAYALAKVHLRLIRFLFVFMHSSITRQGVVMLYSYLFTVTVFCIGCSFFDIYLEV